MPYNYRIFKGILRFRGRSPISVFLAKLKTALSLTELEKSLVFSPESIYIKPELTYEIHKNDFLSVAAFLLRYWPDFLMPKSSK